MRFTVLKAATWRSYVWLTTWKKTWQKHGVIYDPRGPERERPAFISFRYGSLPGGINCLPWHLTTAPASPMQYLYSRVELLAGRILYFRKHLRRRRRRANYYRLCTTLVLSYGTMMKNVSGIRIFRIRQCVIRCKQNGLISLLLFFFCNY